VIGVNNGNIHSKLKQLTNWKIIFFIMWTVHLCKSSAVSAPTSGIAMRPWGDSYSLDSTFTKQKSWQNIQSSTEGLVCRYLSLLLHSINQSTLLQDWKKADVASICKKGIKNCVANYRPVSMTSVMCKVTEHIVCSNMMRHCDNHNHHILIDAKHGFRKRRSCETQLIVTLQDLARIITTEIKHMSCYWTSQKHLTRCLV
jgi:hypothetical protein